MSPSEFTIETTTAPPPPRGAPKSAVRCQMEALKPGEVLRWRPTGNQHIRTAHQAACDIHRRGAARLTVHKVTGGADIYRTK